MNEFQIIVSYINGYLQGISQLCNRINYVPIYEAIPCLNLTSNTIVDIQSQISLKPFEHEECNKCDNFESINEWEKSLEKSLEKWVFQHIHSENISVIKDNTYLLFKTNTLSKITDLISRTVVNNDLKVWKFQIGCGLCYHYGFDNEAYAFKSTNRLFIITFGWAD
jgi:hypothetical protein